MGMVKQWEVEVLQWALRLRGPQADPAEKPTARFSVAIDPSQRSFPSFTQLVCPEVLAA